MDACNLILRHNLDYAFRPSFTFSMDHFTVLTSHDLVGWNKNSCISAACAHIANLQGMFSKDGIPPRACACAAGAACPDSCPLSH